MTIALGIACLACQILQDRNRTDHVRLQFRHNEAQTGGRANKSEQASLLDQTIQNRSRTSRHGTQQVNHDVRGDITGLHLSLQGHVQLQGMQDLSQDERDPQLDQDQFWASELLIEAMRHRLRIVEVPITIRARQAGESKKPKTAKYAWHFAKAIMKTWLR